MNRLEAWLLHLATIALTLSGLIYAGMHYLMKSTDPFSVVGNPWEQPLLKTHILIAPVLVLAVGLIAHTHILLKLGSGAQAGKRTGVVLIPLFAIMTFSGYALQTVTETRRIVMIIHLTSGALWFLLYVFHQISAIRIKRRMADNASARRRFQNGSAF